MRDHSNDKPCSDAHFVSFLFYYYYTKVETKKIVVAIQTAEEEIICTENIVHEA